MRWACRLATVAVLATAIGTASAQGAPEFFWKLPPNGDVSSVAYSPDGSIVASSYNPNLVLLSDAESGVSLRTLVGHTSGVYSVAFSPDGNTIASASYDRTVKLWDVETGALIRTFVGHLGRVNSVTFSPDGLRLASGGEDRLVKVWDTQTGGLIFNLTGHIAGVQRVSFSPDGGMLASASRDSTIKIWNPQTGTLVRTLAGPEGALVDMAFSPDGQMIASASQDRNVRLWDPHTGDLLRTLGHAFVVQMVEFSPDGSVLASAAWGENKVRFWNPSTGATVKVLDQQVGWVYEFSYSPDGKRIAVGASTSNSGVIQDPDSAPPFVAPDGFTVRLGRQDAGNLASLTETDGNALAICKFIVPNQSLPPVNVEVEATSPLLSPQGLAFRSVSRMRVTGSFQQTLELWNWNRNAGLGGWDPVDTRTDALNTTHTMRTLTASGDLTNYLQQSTRRLRARYTVRQTGPSAVSLWCHEADQIGWVVGQ